MSIVSVHGPNTMFAGATQQSTPLAGGAPVFQVVPTQSNGRQVTVTLLQSGRAAADYDWVFGANATPASTNDSKGPHSVTYSVDGAKSIVLTVAAGAGPPVGGTYTVVYVANPGPAD